MSASDVRARSRRRLDARQRQGLGMALLALALRDHHRLAEALMTITRPGEGVRGGSPR